MVKYTVLESKPFTVNGFGKSGPNFKFDDYIFQKTAHFQPYDRVVSEGHLQNSLYLTFEGVFEWKLYGVIIAQKKAGQIWLGDHDLSYEKVKCLFTQFCFNQLQRLKALKVLTAIFLVFYFGNN